MARGRPNPRRRLVSLLVLLATVAAVAWFLLPAPFSHGLILGLLLGPLLLAGVAFLLVRLLRRRMDVALQPPPLPTEPWDYAMELVDLEGAPVDLTDARGSVLVLNFWATRCAPCVAEMPALARLRDATAEVGVRFACVSHDDAGRTRRFLEQSGLDLPVYLAVGETPAPFAHRAVPATFVVDRMGTIALRHLGAAAWDADEVVSFVRALATAPVGLGER